MMRAVQAAWLFVTLLLMVPRDHSTAAAAMAASPVSGTSSPQPAENVPIYAYYNLILDTSFWDRAGDESVLGRYLSDDRSVFQQQIRWAKGAGIDGFLVLWRGFAAGERAQTEDQPAPYLAQLALLEEVAKTENFALAINYQSLDSDNRPSSVPVVTADLAALAKRLGGNPLYAQFGRPLVIWSGTWSYSREDVATVTAKIGDTLTLLASERDVAGYQRIADLVDGNAYFWSSPDPEQTPGYAQKLLDLGAAVRAHGGVWIAPAAPGFDARLTGGARTVPRAGGRTLQEELRAAAASSPNAIGLISWNGFSTGTQVEPSCRDGTESLVALSAVVGGSPPADVLPCSADATPMAAVILPTPTAVFTPTSVAPTPPLSTRESKSGVRSVALSLAALAVVLVVSMAVIILRRSDTSEDGDLVPDETTEQSPSN